MKDQNSVNDLNLVTLSRIFENWKIRDKTPVQTAAVTAFSMIFWPVEGSICSSSRGFSYDGTKVLNSSICRITSFVSIFANFDILIKKHSMVNRIRKFIWIEQFEKGVCQTEFSDIFSESLRFRPLPEVDFEGRHGGQYHFPFGLFEIPTQLKYKNKFLNFFWNFFGYANRRGFLSGSPILQKNLDPGDKKSKR